jgi:PAS domain S-box-containing protein
MNQFRESNSIVELLESANQLLMENKLSEDVSSVIKGLLNLNFEQNLQISKLKDQLSNTSNTVDSISSTSINRSLKLVNEIAKIGTYDWDIEADVWTCSDMMFDIFGLKDDFVFSTENWRKILDDECLNILRHHFNQVVNTRSKFNIEFKVNNIQTKDEQWMLAVGELFFSIEGEPYRLIGTVIDITDHKISEIKIAESEKMLRTSQQVAKLGTYNWDMHKGTWTSSEILDDIFGIDQNYNRTFDGWVRIIHPEWQEKMIHYVQNHVIGKKKRFDMEYQIVNQQTKQKLWVHGMGEVICDHTNNPVRLIGTIIDISIRKRAELALLTSEKRYKGMFSANPLPMCIVDADTLKFLEINATAILHYGYSRSEFLRMQAQDVIYFEHDAESNGIEDLKNSDGQESKIYRHKKKSGEIIYVELSWHRMEYDGKRAYHVMAVDVSESIRLQHQLQQNEKELREIFNFAPLIMVLVDEDRKVQYANESFKFFFEIVDDFSVGQTAGNAFGCVNRSMSPKGCGNSENCEHCKLKLGIEQTFATGQPLYNIDYHLFIKEKSKKRKVSFLASTALIHYERKRCVFICLYDISERTIKEAALRKSKMRYQLLSEGISDGVFITKNGKFDFVNASMAELFGISEHQLLGISMHQLFETDQAKRIEKELNTHYRKDHTSNIEVDFVLQNGVSMALEIKLHYVFNEQLVYGVVHNITKKRQVQERKMLKAIVATEEKERESFSRELHDGIGPLLSINKLYLESLTRAKSDEVRNEIIQKKKEIIDEAINAVKEISNKLSPHMLTNHGISSAIQSYINKANQSGIQTKINFETNCKSRFEMEIEVAIYRAAVESINNSVKYAQAKVIDIRLNETLYELQLEFKDDGIGFNIDKMLNEHKGLGLYNIQNRIRSINGIVKMGSEIGKGVYYQFIVPFR